MNDCPSIDECPYCKSTDIMNDYFEEEWTVWCSFCGRDLTQEAEKSEDYEEMLYENDAPAECISNRNETEGDHRFNPIPSVG